MCFFRTLNSKFAARFVLLSSLFPGSSSSLEIRRCCIVGTSRVYLGPFALLSFVFVRIGSSLGSRLTRESFLDSSFASPLFSLLPGQLLLGGRVDEVAIWLGPGAISSGFHLPLLPPCSSPGSPLFSFAAFCFYPKVNSREHDVAGPSDARGTKANFWNHGSLYDDITVLSKHIYAYIHYINAYVFFILCDFFYYIFFVYSTCRY